MERVRNAKEVPPSTPKDSETLPQSCHLQFRCIALVGIFNSSYSDNGSGEELGRFVKGMFAGESRTTKCTVDLWEKSGRNQIFSKLGNSTRLDISLRK